MMKKILGWVLLVFAMGAVVFILGRNNDECTACKNVVPPYLGDGLEKTEEVKNETNAVERLDVYYFHGTKRCHTCYLLETYAGYVVTQVFSNELANGTVVWHVVNVELPENRHFINDYQLFTKSVVLSHNVNGKEVDWKNMDQIWNLVGDEMTYKKYVQDGIQQMLSGITGGSERQGD